MAEGTAEGDSHMEELLDHGLGMEETAHGLLRRPSLKESYHSDSLLAPDTDFMTGIRPQQLVLSRTSLLCSFGLTSACTQMHGGGR